MTDTEKVLAQAMFDGLAILGFDTDGDTSFVHSYDNATDYAARFLAECREFRQDYDEVLEHAYR